MKKVLITTLCLLSFLVLGSSTPAQATPIEDGVQGVISEMQGATSSHSVDKYAIGKAKDLVFFEPGNENSFLDKVIRFMAVSIGTFAVLAMTIGGYYLVIANGDQNQITKGKSIMTYAIIGVVVSFAAYYIIGLTVTLFTAA
ncbi:MAG TPA: hypothetical protein VIT68_05195 [Candidatus Gracilibacteria bacterium]